MMRLFFGFCLCFAVIGGSQSSFRPAATPDQAYFAETFDANALDSCHKDFKPQSDEEFKKSMDVVNEKHLIHGGHTLQPETTGHVQRSRRVLAWTYQSCFGSMRGTHKISGEWVVEEPKDPRFLGNRGLVLKSPGRHHAISAHLRKVYYFKDKPLCLQYEVFFQKVVDCGGAYIKLLSHSNDLRLSQFSDATPYTIMFGPDKCGSTYKVHFILSHRNPITGTYEEKHARQPDMDLSDYFIDQRPHLYTLNLYPDNTFEILIDMTLINKGSLLEDMEPPVVSLHKTQEPEYSSNVALGDGFQTSDLKLDHERPDGVKAQWNDCTEASGCEHSSHPKSKSQPSRNPNDKGSRGEQQFTMSPVAAVGFELWSLTGDVMFDNILICDSQEVARHWTEDTWGQRKPGMIEKLLLATVKRPWLWGVYVFTVGLPIILFISFMWPNKRFGPPDQQYYYKKTDEPQTDGPQDMEEHITHNDGVNQTRVEAKSRAVKRAVRSSDVTS